MCKSSNQVVVLTTVAWCFLVCYSSSNLNKVCGLLKKSHSEWLLLFKWRLTRTPMVSANITQGAALPSDYMFPRLFNALYINLYNLSVFLIFALDFLMIRSLSPHFGQFNWFVFLFLLIAELTNSKFMFCIPSRVVSVSRIVAVLNSFKMDDRKIAAPYSFCSIRFACVNSRPQSVSHQWMCR